LSKNPHSIPLNSTDFKPSKISSYLTIAQNLTRLGKGNAAISLENICQSILTIIFNSKMG
jgi:hypothetical protein